VGFVNYRVVHHRYLQSAARNLLAGVTRQVGDALLLERSQRSGRVISIGIAPWGIVENNHELCGHNRDVPYHSISSPRYRTYTYCLCLIYSSTYTL